MRNGWHFLALFAVLGICLNTLQADDPPASPERVQELVKMLGSAKFAERDRAKRELETIGAPALDALKKAAKSDDAEVSRRAGELVKALEDKLTNAALLAAKKVRINVKDARVTDVIADLSKQSGYAIEIDGDRAVVAQRKITLDTGDVTFWQAFDQICAKGNLVEIVPVNPYYGDPNEPRLLKGKKGKGGLLIRPLIQPLPIERIFPPPDRDVPPPLPRVNPPALPQGLQAQVLPIQIEGVQPKQTPQPARQLPGLPALPGLDQQENALYKQLMDMVQAMLQAQNKPAPKAPDDDLKQLREALQLLQKLQKKGLAGAAIGGGQPAQPAPAVLDLRSGAPAQGPVAPGQQLPVRVRDGKPTAYPTHYAGSVRIRALPADKAEMFALPPKQEGEVMVILEVTAEPRLQGFQLAGSPRIDKAIDDQEQFLFPNMDEPIKPVAGRLNPSYLPSGLQKYVALRFKADKKPSAELKELAGALTAQVASESGEVVAIDDVLNAAGKSAKLPNGGTMEVVSVVQNGDTYRVRVIMEEPQPAGNGGRVGNAIIIINGRVLDEGFGARQNPTTPSLVDKKGRPFELFSIPKSQTQTVNGTTTYDQTLVFRPQEGQGEPARLVITGTRHITLQVPFTLENVPLSK